MADKDFIPRTLPPRVYSAFRKDDWLNAVDTAIKAGIKDPDILADIVFYMRHRDRIKSSGVGAKISPGEPWFHYLSAERDHYLVIVTDKLGFGTPPSVFLPPIPDPTGTAQDAYEGFRAPQTYGHITLKVNGRNWDGHGGFHDERGTFDEMQAAVEALDKGDHLFIAGWQFMPWAVALNPTSKGTWLNLLLDKARHGVKIRVLIANHPQELPGDIPTLIEKLVAGFPGALKSKSLTQDENFKVLLSTHPAALIFPDMVVHHQKFLIARSSTQTIAFCGGLDIAMSRTPEWWSEKFAWHDVGAKLEGLITKDLERHFVKLWNIARTTGQLTSVVGRDGKTTVIDLDNTKYEELELRPPTSSDQEPQVNNHALQMLRTVSSGNLEIAQVIEDATKATKAKPTDPLPSDPETDDVSVTPPGLRTVRDDIWRGYFRLIARARYFIYMENQYFYEPKLAEAIVNQWKAHPTLIVLVMGGTGTDDKPNNVMEHQFLDHEYRLRLQFYNVLIRKLPKKNLGVYTLNYTDGILHSKMILVDDLFMSVGSANANPRGFFLDTEVNVMLDSLEDQRIVREFRERLWSHNLGVPQSDVAGWGTDRFFDNWDRIAKNNQGKQSDPKQMQGEGVIPFQPLNQQDDPRSRDGKWGSIEITKDMQHKLQAEIRSSPSLSLLNRLLKGKLEKLTGFAPYRIIF